MLDRSMTLVPPEVKMVPLAIRSWPELLDEKRLASEISVGIVSVPPARLMALGEMLLAAATVPAGLLIKRMPPLETVIVPVPTREPRVPIVRLPPETMVPPV